MPERRNDAPSVRIINHKKYILEKRNLLCEFHVRNPKLWIDIYSKTKRLYYPQGKEFVLETKSDFTDTILETIILSKEKAQQFMNEHPEGINEKVYKRYFGEPEKL